MLYADCLVADFSHEGIRKNVNRLALELLLRVLNQTAAEHGQHMRLRLEQGDPDPE